jgi:hypothetical protein
VFECREVEIRAQLSVDTPQQVLVERGGDAFAVVVRVP